MLYDIYRLVQDFTVLVSYNGKSFDWPLLKDRFILARFEPLCKLWVHLDLCIQPGDCGGKLCLTAVSTIEQYVLEGSAGTGYPRQ